MATQQSAAGVGRRGFIKAAAAAASSAGLPQGAALAADGKIPPFTPPPWPSPKGTSVRGRVIVPGAKDVSGIVVSNGRDCALTDGAGAFELPTYEGMRFVFVTVPSGCRATWSYKPYPNRSAGHQFNFWLSRYGRTAAGRPCRFIHIADSETGDLDRDEAWKARLRRLGEREDAAFIVHTGDLCFRYGILAHFQTVNFSTMGRPVFYCIGNHDLEPASRGEETFEAVNGPSWYSFDACGVHFVVTPMPIGDAKPSYTGDQVAEWVENDLKLVKKGTPVVFFNHMISNWEGSKDTVGFTYGNRRRIRLGDLCRFSGFVYGHTHHNYMRRVGKGGETVFVCTAPPNKGGIGHDPESFRILTVEPGGRMTSRLEFGMSDSWKPSRAGAEWEARLRSPVMFSSPIVSGGRVYAGLSDENAEGLGGVVALDAATGRELWCADVPGSVFNKLALCGGNIVAQTKSGGVYAFGAADGEPAWSFEGNGHAWIPVQSGLVDDGEGVVFAGTPTRIVALDAKTGAVMWREGNHGDKPGEASADTPACAEGVLVFSSNWRGLYGYDAKTGVLLWKRSNSEDSAFGFPGATPLIRDGRILHLCGKMIFELDLRTGRTLRSKAVGAGMQVTTRILPTRHGLAFGTADRGLVLVDGSSFEQVRTFAPGPSLTTYAPYVSSPKRCVGTAPVAVGTDAVAATATDGALHVWNLVTGRESKKFDTGAPYLADAAFDGKRLYVADIAGFVRAFEV